MSGEPRAVADVLHVMDGWSATGASSRQRSLLLYSGQRHRGVMYGGKAAIDDESRAFVMDRLSPTFPSRLPFGSFVWQILFTSLRLARRIVLAGRSLRRTDGHDRLFVHSHQGPVCVTASIIAALWLRAPLVYEEHVPLADYGPSHQHWLISVLERLAVTRASVVITQTRASADLLCQRTRRMPRVVVVPNSVDLKLFERDRTAARAAVRLRLGLDDSAVLATYAGFLDDIYNSIGDICGLVGPSGLADRGVHLVIAGDGPSRALVEDCASKSPWVHWAGVLSHEEVVELLLGSELGLVLRFTNGEAVDSLVPLKLYEVMAAGAVPIVTDRPALADEVAGGRGLVIDSLDEVGPAIDRALASRVAIGCAARERVTALSWRTSAESLDSAYFEFADVRRGR